MKTPIHKTFKFRLYPSKAQIALLEGVLSECCRLYNGALDERRGAWDIARKPISLYEQQAQLKEIRASGDLAIPSLHCARNVLRRVDLAFAAFFRRCKTSAKSGYPRYRSFRRYSSFGSDDGYKILDNGKLRLKGIGQIKLKLHRPIEGTIRTCSVKREAGKWYVFFVVAHEPVALLANAASVGIDVGLTTFAALSDRTEIENPRYYRDGQSAIRRAQRKMERRKQGSTRRRKAVQLLQRTHAHVRNQRSNFHHQASERVVANYGLIAIEDLNVKGLAGGMLARDVRDAGWSAFFRMLAYKAENAGRVFVKVNCRGTSQRCPCGASVPKTLAQRWHYCEACGLSVKRDVASAMEVLRLGLNLQAQTWSATACVA